jgi:hypothetical protein
MMIISRADGVSIHWISEEHQSKDKEPEYNHLEDQPETNSSSFSPPIPCCPLSDPPESSSPDPRKVNLAAAGDTNGQIAFRPLIISCCE